MIEILNQMYSNYQKMVKVKKDHGVQLIGQLLWVSPPSDMKIMKKVQQIITGKNQLECIVNHKIIKKLVKKN